VRSAHTYCLLAELDRRAFIVEKNELLDPIQLHFFGAQRVRFFADRLAEVAQPGWWMMYGLIDDGGRIPALGLNVS
jgi:hypothetical protein